MKRLLQLTLGLAPFAAFAFATIIIVLVFQHRRDAAAEACQSQNQTRAAVADVFRLLEQVATEAQKTPPAAEQAERTRRFFDGVQARLKPIDC